MNVKLRVPSRKTLLPLCSPSLSKLMASAIKRRLLGWAATCSKGFVKCFPRVPRLLGCTASAMLPKQARETFRKHITKPSEQVAAPPSTQVHLTSVASPTSRDAFKMMLLKSLLILGFLSFSIPATSGLPNIVFILLDDVDVQLTGLKVWAVALTKLQGDSSAQRPGLC